VQETTEKTATPVRLTGLVAVTDRLREAMWRLASAGPPPWPAELLTAIRSAAQRVESLCRDRGGPAELPAASRRAYQWLDYLAQDGRLEAHLATQRLAATIAGRVRHERGRPPGLPPLRVDFYNTAMLYRVRPLRAGARADGLLVTAGEGFVGAPAEVVEALVRLALPGARRRMAGLRAAVASYAAGPDFRAVTLALELAAPPPGGGRGRHHDLGAVFEKVNADCFKGRLTRPILTWGASTGGRRLGYYSAVRDTVTLSPKLDDPAVPSYVVEFVMYHELLHRVMGAKVAGSRRYHHTPAFREAERQFPRWAEAKAYLRADH